MESNGDFASAIYVGHVEHDRYTPKKIKFTYKIHHLYLDLDELDTVFDKFLLTFN